MNITFALRNTPENLLSLSANDKEIYLKKQIFLNKMEIL